jgi:hypothetical protein
MLQIYRIHTNSWPCFRSSITISSSSIPRGGQRSGEKLDPEMHEIRLDSKVDNDSELSDDFYTVVSV